MKQSDPLAEFVKEWQPRCHVLSREKGWWDREVDPLGPGEPRHGHLRALRPDLVFQVVPKKISLIHSEISEADEARELGHLDTFLGEDGKPEGVPAEIADVAIRAFDLAEALGMPICAKIAEIGTPRIPGLETEILRLHRYASRVLEGYRADNHTTMHIELATLVRACATMGELHGFDLGKEIEQKHAFNMTRPHLHGGKRA